jgi:hypothetical protein
LNKLLSRQLSIRQGYALNFLIGEEISRHTQMATHMSRINLRPIMEAQIFGDLWEGQVCFLKQKKSSFGASDVKFG